MFLQVLIASHSHVSQSFQGPGALVLSLQAVSALLKAPVRPFCSLLSYWCDVFFSGLDATSFTNTAGFGRICSHLAGTSCDPQWFDFKCGDFPPESCLSSAGQKSKVPTLQLSSDMMHHDGGENDLRRSKRKCCRCVSVDIVSFCFEIVIKSY